MAKRTSGLPKPEGVAQPLSAQTLATGAQRSRKGSQRAAFALPPEFIARVAHCTRHDLDEVVFHGEQLFRDLFLPKLFELLKEDARQRLENDEPHAPNLAPDGSGRWLTTEKQAAPVTDTGIGLDPGGVNAT